ncbi:Uncharacterized protein APZ42_012295 [Daphnia magna]|uniref:Uncharacterized protein n=1 Tax=Daphnia magna TaxID=35525 RepID=A0A162RZS4_9CRUS|nr:Uncharacterized protein APZ42_012295 [Daphnia magna]
MSGVEENNCYKNEEIPSSNVASVNLQETKLDLFEEFHFESQLTADLPTVSSRVECHPKVYLLIICLAFKVKYNLSKACLQDHLRILSLTTECSIEEIKSAAKCF